MEQNDPPAIGGGIVLMLCEPRMKRGLLSVGCVYGIAERRAVPEAALHGTVLCKIKKSELHQSKIYRLILRTPKFMHSWYVS